MAEGSSEALATGQRTNDKTAAEKKGCERKARAPEKREGASGAGRGKRRRRGSFWTRLTRSLWGTPPTVHALYVTPHTRFASPRTRALRHHPLPAHALWAPCTCALEHSPLHMRFGAPPAHALWGTPHMRF